ncbi:MAG: methionyl-tRNA formyltransferase [Planctomycetota bacterium]|nr:MAG: methionyl-tRNA formyltransferase [Planctomycetota bacterium]
MRVIMMGTGPFAVPTFRALLNSAHEVPALFTRPERPQKGRSKAPPNPMRALGEERGLRIHEPESVNAPEARMVLASYRPDLLVVCDYGQILKASTLEIARLGGINLHASLLPKYRGAAPINWALYHGETETGVTVIHMTPQLDAGPAIAQARTPIGPDETAAELEPRLAELGAPLVLQAVGALESGTAAPLEQDANLTTRAPRLRKEHGAVDWRRTAAEIHNQVRSLKPWPKTHTFWHREGGAPLRLILDRVHAEPGAGEPGVVLAAEGERLVVGTGGGTLALEAVQPAGKRVLDTAEFLRGYPVRAGEHFGPE